MANHFLDPWTPNLKNHLQEQAQRVVLQANLSISCPLDLQNPRSRPASCTRHNIWNGGSVKHSVTGSMSFKCVLFSLNDLIWLVLIRRFLYNVFFLPSSITKIRPAWKPAQPAPRNNSSVPTRKLRLKHANNTSIYPVLLYWLMNRDSNKGEWTVAILIEQCVKTPSGQH